MQRSQTIQKIIQSFRFKRDSWLFHRSYKELVRVKNEYHQANGYGNYHMTYGQFMDTVYIPAYETEVEESTFYVRKRTLESMRDRFSNIELRYYQGLSH